MLMCDKVNSKQAKNTELHFISCWPKKERLRTQIALGYFTLGHSVGSFLKQKEGKEKGSDIDQKI